MKRTHTCGELRKTNAQKSVILNGWVHSWRDHGGVLFLDLRDREGIVQIVIRPEEKVAYELANTIRSEFVIEVEGTVSLRPEGTINPNLPTGEIEVEAKKISILNPSLALPFEISQYSEASEEIRLKYRYLDLRRPTLQKNLTLRHQMTHNVRSTLNKEKFLEIETPFLTKSTPEGARDFLVPSRLSPGQFYALPQSPQIFKQILMVGGMERYYQIVRCFRDEDLRADRQPEFTQIDIEMSFVDENDVMGITEKIVKAAFEAATGKTISTPFQRIPYRDAMNRYGSDKPDTRFEMELVDLTEHLANCGFQVFSGAVKNKGVIKAMCLKGGAKCSRAEIDSLTEYVKQLGAKGLAWMKITDSGPESSIIKFFSKEDLSTIQKQTAAQAGDILFFGAGPWKSVVTILGMLRVELNRRFNVIPDEKKNDFHFLWVVDFPLLEWDGTEKRWNAMHHPFTSPKEEHMKYLEKDQGQIQARAYDIVVNGTEIGGGSVRIHRKDVQSKVFKALGINETQAKEKFGFLLSALEYGAPPHGGIALGLDRMVAIALGEDSIRDTIAFPKTQKGVCMLSSAPAEVAKKQLDELYIKTAVPQPTKKPAKEPVK